MKSGEPVTVVVEYSEQLQKVTVRGVWRKGEVPHLDDVLPDTTRNFVHCFFGVDHKVNGAFRGLIPSDGDDA